MSEVIEERCAYIILLRTHRHGDGSEEVRVLAHNGHLRPRIDHEENSPALAQFASLGDAMDGTEVDEYETRKDAWVAAATHLRDTNVPELQAHALEVRKVSILKRREERFWTDAMLMAF